MGFILEGLCVVGLLVHGARRTRACRDSATATSEQLNHRTNWTKRNGSANEWRVKRTYRIAPSRMEWGKTARAHAFGPCLSAGWVALVKIRRRSITVTRHEVDVACADCDHAIGASCDTTTVPRLTRPPIFVETSVFLDM